MDARDFTYWLQGYLEVSGVKELDEKQLNIIKDHLKLVFDKQTPNYGYNQQAGGSIQILPGQSQAQFVC